MNRHISVLRLTLIVLLASLWAAVPGVDAASDGTLEIHAVGCDSFSLTATFHGDEDEGEGVDYVRLRVLDAAGNVVYSAAPWQGVYGEDVTVEVTANYERTPAAGALLFILEDYQLLGLRQLQSLASEYIVPDCQHLPVLDAASVTASCALRLRTGPGLNYRWRMFLPQGTNMTVIGRLFDASWLQVRVDDGGMLGWVYDGLCVPGSPDAATYESAPVTYFLTPEEVLRYEGE